MRCIATWAQILAAVPKSRLMLKGRAYADATVAGRIRTIFARHGIEGRRLDLRGWTVSQATHLDTYRKIDIALGLEPFRLSLLNNVDSMVRFVDEVAHPGDGPVGAPTCLEAGW